jgi:hypothetical protein
MPETSERAQFEEGFRRAGLPMLIDSYRPSMETYRKAAPLFGVVSMLELLILSAQGISLFGTLLACLASGIGFAFLPRIHHWIPLNAVQAQLLVFIVLPVGIAGFLGGLSTALIVAGINVSLLAIVTGGSGYGLFAIVVWTSTHLLDQLKACVGLLSRAIPLLMIFSLLIFVTAEIWETVATMPAHKLGLIVVLFLGLGAVFLVVHVPEELTAVEEGVLDKHPITRKERFNLFLIIVVGQMVQAFVVGAAVGIFFTLLGMIMVDSSAVQNWSQAKPDVIFDVPLLGNFTVQLLSVTVFMATFTSFYFTIAILTDDVYRREFGREVSEELQAIFVQRDQYLDLIKKDKLADRSGQ